MSSIKSDSISAQASVDAARIAEKAARDRVRHS